jgi:hypothetical protein
MADYRAVAAVTEAMASLLESRYMPDTFGGQQLIFKVYRAKDFAEPMQTGVSVFLYRISVDRAANTSILSPLPGGRPGRTPMALDLHFLMTAWARDASLQHAIASWMMRVLYDNPYLPAELLNRIVPDSFRSDETVRIFLAASAPEILFRVWKLIGQAYEISVLYEARTVMVE